MKDSSLEIDRLLAAIPGEHPAGDETAYQYYLRDAINELRREEMPADFDDATRPAQLKRADWAAVAKLCEDALQSKAKDLRVVCHMMEALVKLSGFTGLREGLTLLVRMLDECWDNLLPAIENGDSEDRAVMLENLLDDPDRGVLFPHVVRRAPLFGTDEARFSLADWIRVSTMEKCAEKEVVQRALERTPTIWTDQIASEVEACHDEFMLLMAAVDGRMGEVAPALTNLRSSIHDCRQFVRDCLKHSTLSGNTMLGISPVSGQELSAPQTTSESTIDQVTSGTGMATRSDAYALLATAADLLAKIEPHSPTPYLIRRAVELGKLPFPQWIPSLMKEETVLADLMKGVEKT